MGWSVPQAPVPEKATPWSPWICVFIIGAGYLAALAWVVVNAPADGLPPLSSGFYLPLTGYALAGSLFFLTLYLLWWEIQALCCYNPAWWQHNTDIAWQRWAQEYLCVAKAITLTPDSQLIDRMAGVAMEEATDDNADKPKLLLPGEALIPGIRRFEQLCHALLEDVTPTLKSIDTDTPFSVYLQTSGDVDQAEKEALHTLLTSRFPSRKFELHLLSDTAPFSIWNQTMLASRLPVLVLAMHYRQADETLTEIATALFFVPPALLKPAERNNATRVFRAMPVNISRLADDLKELKEMQQQPAERVNLVWFSGLTDSVRQKLGTLVHDLKLPLRTSASMGGLLDFDKDNEQYGAFTAWLLIGAAVQMVEKGQGGQWILCTDKNDAWAWVAGDQQPKMNPPKYALPAEPYPAGSAALSLLFNLVLFWSLGIAWPAWLFSGWGFASLILSLLVTLPASAMVIRLLVKRLQKPRFIEAANASVRD